MCSLKEIVRDVHLIFTHELLRVEIIFHVHNKAFLTINVDFIKVTGMLNIG